MLSPSSFNVYTLSNIAFSINLISYLINTTNRHIYSLQNK
nr:MAG TPA: hypothetical protein [Caudoviricetes sp.]